MASKNPKITFVYLYYTDHPKMGNVFLFPFKSFKTAKKHVESITSAEMVPSNELLGISCKRVLQAVNKTTGQVWYVERWVMRED